MRLLNTDRELAWTPYLWLMYLGFLFLQPLLGHEPWQAWLALAAVIAVFLPLYFGCYRQPFGRRRVVLNTACIAALGFAYLPFNRGAGTFWIYAAAIIPFGLGAGATVAVIAALLLLIVVEGRLLHLPPVVWTPTLSIAAGIGVGNIFFAQQRRANSKLRMAHEEIEHLAKLAERERIARDLHDVLGHTLSLIVLKAELAGRLIDRDATRAASEIHDVEETARKALAEVREAIGGYRSEGIAAEVKRAQRTLEVVGVEAHCEISAPRLAPVVDTVLALAVREAVTNIVRHARASRCSLKLQQTNGTCSLLIEDDGCGGVVEEGNGLRGMRERVEALGGSLRFESDQGTRLSIQVPAQETSH
jgi:two-component system sensor histidine kinase DesK